GAARRAGGNTTRSARGCDRHGWLAVGHLHAVVLARCDPHPGFRRGAARAACIRRGQLAAAGPAHHHHQRLQRWSADPPGQKICRGNPLPTIRDDCPSEGPQRASYRLAACAAQQRHTDRHGDGTAVWRPRRRLSGGRDRVRLAWRRLADDSGDRSPRPARHPCRRAGAGGVHYRYQLHRRRAVHTARSTHSAWRPRMSIATAATSPRPVTAEQLPTSKNRSRRGESLGAVLVAIVVLTALVSLVWTPQPPGQQDLNRSLLPPAWLDGGVTNHPLGTDLNG